MDEPTLGLDPQTRNHMWSYLQDLNKEEGITVFFTTHYMEEAERIAQRIAIIDHGKIIAAGTAEELKPRKKTDSLEDAFLKLTGTVIRDEDASADRPHARAPQYGAAGDRRTNIFKFPNSMKTIYILWLREIKRYLRSKSRIIGSLGQPLLFLLALGYGLGSVFAKAGEGNYFQFLAPGIIGMSIIFTAIFSGIQIIWDRQFGFLKRRSSHR